MKRTEPMSRWDCNGRREAPPGQRPPQHPGQNNGVGGAPPLPFESGKDGSAERSQVQLRLPKAQNVTRTPGYTHVGSVGMTTDTRLPVRYPPATAPYAPYHQQQQPAAPAANGINGVQRPAALYPAYGWTSQSRAIPPNRGATGCTQPNKFTDSIYPQRPLPPSGDSSCATFGKYNTPRNGLRIARTLASSSMAHSGSPASSTSLSSSSSKVQRKTLRAGAKRYSAKALPGKLEVVSGKRVASHTQIARKSLPVTGGSSSTGGSSQRLGTSGGIGRHEHQQAVGANSINALVPGTFVLGGSQPQQLQSLGGSLQPMNGGRMVASSSSSSPAPSGLHPSVSSSTVSSSSSSGSSVASLSPTAAMLAGGRAAAEAGSRSTPSAGTSSGSPASSLQPGGFEFASGGSDGSSSGGGSPAAPGWATALGSSSNRNGKVQLVIMTQPEQQHRARYQTEGSRGAVKDRSGNGFPVVRLVGYSKPTVLQVFIGTDEGQPTPHIFYQACRVSGKNSTPCTERKLDGTTVIEMQLKPDAAMTATCDCVGILKERNVDVEHRFPEQTATLTKNKSTRCRMVFRTFVTGDDGLTEVLQPSRRACRKSA